MIQLFVTLFLFTAFLGCIYTIVQHHMSPFRAFMLAIVLTVGITFSMAKLKEGLNIKAVFGYNRNANDFLQLDGILAPENGNFTFSGFQLRGPTETELSFP